MQERLLASYPSLGRTLFGERGSDGGRNLEKETRRKRYIQLNQRKGEKNRIKRVIVTLRRHDSCFQPRAVLFFRLFSHIIYLDDSPIGAEVDFSRSGVQRKEILWSSS